MTIHQGPGGKNESTNAEPFGLIISSAMLIALSACAGDSRTRNRRRAAPRTTATEPRLLAEEYVEGEAVVQAVNKTDRTVTLRNAQGQSNTIAVPADVDLNRLKKGDRVSIGVYQTLSLRVLPPGRRRSGPPLPAAAPRRDNRRAAPGASNWSSSTRLPPSTSPPYRHAARCRRMVPDGCGQGPADARPDAQPEGRRSGRTDLLGSGRREGPAEELSSTGAMRELVDPSCRRQSGVFLERGTAKGAIVEFVPR